MSIPAKHNGGHRVLLILDREASRYRQCIESAGFTALRIVEGRDPDALPAGSESAEIVLGPPEFLARALPTLPSLRWAQSTWAGVEPLLVQGARRDYLLSGIKGVFGSQMAEYVLCYLLVHGQGVLARHDAQLRQQWAKIPPSPLRNRRVVILGTGSIGQDIAMRCSQFGMHVVGVNRSGRPSRHCHRVLPVERMLDGLADADFLVLALPGTGATRHLVDGKALAALPPHALLINVGRGSVLDTDALVTALENGALGGAVLDVFESEPLQGNDRLWSVPKLLITAHVSAVSFVEEIAPLFIGNLQRYLNGQSPRHLVDFERGY